MSDGGQINPATGNATLGEAAAGTARAYSSSTYGSSAYGPRAASIPETTGTVTPSNTGATVSG